MFRSSPARFNGQLPCTARKLLQYCELRIYSNASGHQIVEFRDHVRRDDEPVIGFIDDMRHCVMVGFVGIELCD
jgi:hypothetical protein